MPSVVDTTRKEIKELLIKFIKGKEKYLHLNYFPGAGKTHLVIRTLYDKFQSFIYLSPYHSLAEEQLKKFVFLKDIEHIKSRRLLCQNDKYKELPEKNISISIMCEECPFNPYNKKSYLSRIHPCEYYRRLITIKQNPQPWFGVHHHLGGLVQDYVNSFKGGTSVVVIDENPIGNIKTNININYNILMKNLHFFYKLKKSKEKELLLYLINNLKNIVTTTTEEVESGKKLINYRKLFDSILRKLPKIKMSNLKELDLEFQVILAEQFFKNKDRCPRNIISSLISFLIEVYEFMIKEKDPFDFFQNTISIYKNKFSEDHYANLLFYNLDKLKIEDGVKVIFLDATTSPSFYEHIIGEKILSSSKDVSLDSSIYQLNSGNYPMKSLDWKQKGSEICKTKEDLKEILKLICKKHKDTKVLVICRKKYEEELKKVSKNISTTHYPISGSNIWEKETVVVLFGCPEFSSTYIERTSSLLQIPEEEIRSLGRESLMIQGIHRIRPVLSIDLKYIYILSKVDLNIINVRKLDKSRLKKFLEEEIKYGIVDFMEIDVRNKIITEILKYESKTFKEIKELLDIKIGTEMLKGILEDLITYEGSIKRFKRKKKILYGLFLKKSKLLDFIKDKKECSTDDILLNSKMIFGKELSRSTILRKLKKLEFEGKIYKLSSTKSHKGGHKFIWYV